MNVTMTYTDYTPIKAADVHAAIGDWPAMLERMGIGTEFLQNRHGPCPACGGKDRYRFDNRHGRGDFYCNGCGAGDGFALLQRTHGWTFVDTLNALAEALGLQAGDGETPAKKNSVRSEQQTERTVRLDEKHRQAADRATDLWQKAGEPDPDHPYLRGKAVGVYGIRQLGKLLYVPMRDSDGKLWSLQFISPDANKDNDKVYLKYSRTKGMIHVIGERTPRIWLAEGYATGASLHEDTGECVVVAFNCHGLLPVARVVKSWMPQRIAIMADDDHMTPNNPGINAAKKASEKLGCDWYQPAFPPDRPAWATDYNDSMRLWATRAAS